MNTSQIGAASGYGSAPTEGLELGSDRFGGRGADLSALAAQVRRARDAGDAENEARLCAALARGLARRGIETRETLALAERAAARGEDGALASELSLWWAGVGDPSRAAQVLQRVESRAASEDRPGVLMRIGVLLARAGQGAEAARAFQGAAAADASDPLALELLGSLGGWNAIAPEIASRAFQDAADRRVQLGDETAAFEDCIRAFEACPSDALAAERLAIALSDRGRVGAAEEIIREQARSGSAARRAAIHERRFARHAAALELDAAFGAALDAELDAGLDAGRLVEVLSGSQNEPAKDAESVFVHMARQDARIAEWLLAALDAGVFAWGLAASQDLRARIGAVVLGDRRVRGGIEHPQSAADFGRKISGLREAIGRSEGGDHEARSLDLGRLFATRGAWAEAHDVLEPLLAKETLSVEAACLIAVLSARARRQDSRARALAHVARGLTGRLRAVVASVAAELLLESGRLAEARSAAELAVVADPSWQRGVAAQALVAQRDPDAAAAVLLERSLSVVVARAAACHVLAESSEKRGALRLALTWTQRELALKPGDPAVARELLRRAALAGDGERLADALSWLLSQPLPLSQLADAVADSLRALIELAPERATEVARRVLDVVGPRFESVRAAVLEVARAGSVYDLDAQVIERFLVTAPPDARGLAQLELAELRGKLGDVMAAARALRRALANGVNPDDVALRLEALPEPDSADALLAVLEARAEAKTAQIGASSGDARQNAELYWTLGSARWELTKDQRGAVAAWTQALVHDDQDGAERLALNLLACAGADGAMTELERIASTLDDRGLRSRLLALAARMALDAHLSAEAFRLARVALETNPTNTDVLSVAEVAAGPGDIDHLAALYEYLAGATLGRYGERAVHYRAARQLERQGRDDQALKHAIAAFEAVPAEGVAFVLMARLSDRAGAASQVVGALERVAGRTPAKDQTALWLQRAAALADTSDSGRRQRLDVLLRALAVRPDPATLGTVIEAARQLVAACPEDLDIVLLRFERALGTLLPKVGGPEGAFFSIRAARGALEVFGASELGMRALARAADCDGDLEQFGELEPLLDQLLEAQAGAVAFVKRVAERSSQRLTNVGRPLALLGAKLAERLGEREAEARLLIRAATEDPNDAETVRRARRLAEELDEPELLGLVEDLLPVDDRARQIVAQSENARVDEALDMLLEIDLAATSDEVRAVALAALARRQEEIGRLDDAAASYASLAELLPEDLDALRGLERAAERRNDFEEVVRLLERRAELAPESSEARRIRMRKATLLEQRLGRPEAARTQLEQLLTQGEELSVLRLLADLCRRTGDPARAAALWLRASGAALDRDEAEELLIRSAEAYLDASDVAGARRALDSAVLQTKALEQKELRVRVERQGGDAGRLSDALAELAEELGHDAPRAAALLSEAARLCLDRGDRVRALTLSSKAAELSPRSSEAQLFARRLEYLARGAGNLEQAQKTVQELRPLTELTHRQMELRAFLLAEALDVAEGGSAGRRELDLAAERVGSRALVAVGLAERMDEDPRRALSLLDAALGSDMHGLRSEGQVLIRAGRAARALNELDRAQAYFSAVANDDARQPEAASELREIAAERVRAEREAHERQQREREEALRAERERAERERAERMERERLEREAKEQAAREKAEREAQARAEREARAKEAREKAERERQEREREERDRVERARIEREAREAAERERLEREAEERAEREREARARAERERQEREQYEYDRVERARMEREAREAAEREQAAREAAERAQREAHEAAEREARLEREALERAQREARERAEREALEAEARARAQREAREAEAYARAERDRAERERQDREAQERDERARAEREAYERAELDRIEREAQERARREDYERAQRELAARQSHISSPRERVVALGESERASSVPPSPARSSMPPPESARASASQRPSLTNDLELRLAGALEGGDLDAGRQLLVLLERDPNRSRDRVLVASRLAWFSPGDAWVLEQLARAAESDRNEPLHLAARHVLGAFGAGRPVTAPELGRLEEHAEAVRRMISRGIESPGVAAAALVWEHVPHAFKREPGAYGITGLERLPLGSPTVLGRLYTESARVLGAGRTPLFQRRGAGAITMAVALLTPPALLVSGDVDEVTPELSFHFGAMMMATSPEYAILFGADPSKVRTLLEALLVSFAPPSGQRPNPAATRLAALLWESVPPRAQRRLGQLCADPGLFAFDLVIAQARYALRRAGLVVGGDLWTAVAATGEEEGFVPPDSISSLAEACQRSPAVLDLVRLALSPEYAEVRWNLR